MPPTTLDTLPLDIQYSILRYLDLPHPSFIYEHPFLTLSLVSTTLHSAVESHCTHLLHRLLSRFPSTAPKRIPPTNSRRTYLTHTTKRCRFCNTKTTAVAKIFNFIPCCRICDARQWPEKITLTKARTTYGLSAEMLMARCNWGGYYCVGVYTRMFDEREVRKLAEMVHGDLEAYFERKRLRSEKRRMRKAERVAAVVRNATLAEIVDLTGEGDQGVGGAGSAVPTTARDQGGNNSIPTTTGSGGAGAPGQMMLTGTGGTDNTHPPATGDGGAVAPVNNVVPPPPPPTAEQVVDERPNRPNRVERFKRPPWMSVDEYYTYEGDIYYPELDGYY
ncbi:hypothetical protein K440DRAFT_663738 [Wilcoxina mikolae CBS 423.85]|nr:hypothetical protein K440DRAFT_663738 [Wilcoxina mikolae CBS 423.85]